MEALVEWRARFARPNALAVGGGALAFRRLRRHQGMLAVCALFLLSGALALDDYGVSVDVHHQIAIGNAALDSLAGGGERALDQLYAPHDRYYGAAFEAPLVLVERVLGLEDFWDIYLARHFLTHLFFLVGGAFCYLIVHRFFGSKMLALIAMALFLLHPRIYAHSFYNTKDIPFLVMFMIALYLTHRAFRRDTLGAFLFCGVGVGLLVNLRIMGLVLFAAVLALRALELPFAGGTDQRKRILLEGGAFVLAALLTYYASLPALWTDPIGQFTEAFDVLGSHPIQTINLFRGEWFSSPDGPPLDYIPVWIGITTPPVVLLLAVVGVAGLLWCGARSPRSIRRGTFTHFGLLLLLLPVASIAVIVVNESNIYNGWRQVFFLYAPITLLAAAGVHRILSLTERRWMRAGTYALLAACLAVTLVSMVRVHPLAYSYYNGLVDRNRPDYLVSQYDAVHSGLPYWSLLRNALTDHPDQKIIYSRWLGDRVFVFPEPDRYRIKASPNIVLDGFYSDRPVSSRKYVARIYSNTLASIKGWQFSSEMIEDTILDVRSNDPVFRSEFITIHLQDDKMTYTVESCSQYQNSRVFLHLYPDSAVFPQVFFRNWDFFISDTAIGSDGRCVFLVFLPEWTVSNVHTGQYERGSSGFWETRFSVTIPSIAPAVLAREPLASTVFDIYRDENTLVYVRDSCSADDAEASFFLHVNPIDPNDLPAGSARQGFENRDFDLWRRGGRVGNRCVAVVGLPDYPIASIRTGQYDETGERWHASFAVTLRDVDPATLADELLASAAFDIYRDDDTIIYVRERCTEKEAAAAFLLHVYPVDVDDLPADRARYGFGSLDFELRRQGGRVGERCVAAVALPDYPIASIRTGQYDETGEIWSVEFALPDGE